MKRKKLVAFAALVAAVVVVALVALSQSASASAASSTITQSSGTSDKLPIILWIGILAVAVGVTLIFVYRRRSSRSGDHRS